MGPEARLERLGGVIQGRRDGILKCRMAVIVQWQNAGLWIRMSWVRPPLAAPSMKQPRVAKAALFCWLRSFRIGIIEIENSRAFVALTIDCG